jgi:integrase
MARCQRSLTTATGSVGPRRRCCRTVKATRPRRRGEPWRRHASTGRPEPGVLLAVVEQGLHLAAVAPHGPHDLRHTFSTWLEDAGIPAQVIDELMGHERSRHGELEGGSRIGARYRHTTPEMAVRISAAIQKRLGVVVRRRNRSSRPAAPAAACARPSPRCVMACNWQ